MCDLLGSWVTTSYILSCISPIQALSDAVHRLYIAVHISPILAVDAFPTADLMSSFFAPSQLELDPPQLELDPADAPSASHGSLLAVAHKTICLNTKL